MIKSVLVVGSVVVLLGVFGHQLPLVSNAVHPAQSCQREIEQAVERAKSTHKLVLVKFGSSWCVPCRKLEALLKSPELAPLLAPHFEIVVIDYAEDDAHKSSENAGAAEWLKNHDIEPTLPVMTIVDRSGKVIKSSLHPSREFELPSVDGPPFSYARIGSFLHFISEACPQISPSELQKIRSVLEKSLP